ncbi:MAG: RNase adapter RapZ [Desulfobacterales bacterium]
MIRLRIVIITGLSGSGKSTAMTAFEDAGFYCVDNMPVALLPKFLELPVESSSEIAGLAFVMDLREKGFLSGYAPVFDFLRKKGYRFQILFLEADDQVLLRRYSETRRYHPMGKDISIAEGIRLEREQLRELRNAADRIVNTSHYTVHELKKLIRELAGESGMPVPMRIRILSFGFKYGIPHDADLIMDVRFLANPYFVPELKSLDGKTPEVRAYVLDREETGIFMEKFFALLDYLIPLYEKEGKAYLTLALGCTGGKHRSVAVAGAVHDHVNTSKRWVNIVHRDIGKE